jgi:hypothetical protein
VKHPMEIKEDVPPIVPIEINGQDGLVCMCCFTEISVNDRIPCRNGHLFCRYCVKSLLEHALSRKQKIVCVAQTDDEFHSVCDASFTEKELCSACPLLSTCYSKMIARVSISSCLDKNKDLFIGCHDCDNGIVVDRCGFFPSSPNGNGGMNIPSYVCKDVFTCSACSAKSCIRCGKKGHERDKGEHCSRKLFTFFPEDAKNEQEVIFCKCGEKFTKDNEAASCNKMECRCGRTYCYICGAKLSRSCAYLHFKQWPDGLKNYSGSCPLFGGEKKRYKRNFISKAIRYFLN